MKIIGDIEADVSANFFHSLGDHVETQHHAPADFNYDQAAAAVLAAQADLTAAAGDIIANTAAIATKSAQADMLQAQADIATNTTAVATKSTQADMLLAQAELAGLGKFVDVPNKKLVHEDDHFLAVDNLRVVAVDNPAPTDNVPAGLFFTKGTFSESLSLIDDARVDLVASSDDPAENDNSTLRSSLSFGAVGRKPGPARQGRAHRAQAAPSERTPSRTSSSK